MKQGLMIAALLCAPQFCTAQEFTIDQQIVRDCFENTEIGALYPFCLGEA